MSDDVAPHERGIGLTAGDSDFSSAGWPGATALSSVRHRRRAPLLIAAVVVVVVLAAGVVVATRGGSVDRNRRVAEQFLDAWTAGNTARMQTLVRPPADVAADLKAVMAGLHPSTTSYHLDRISQVNGRLTASFTATDMVTGLGTWTYHSSFPIISTAHGPAVVWSRSVIDPQLGPALVLDRTRTWPTRAAILGAGGQTLAGMVDTVTVGVEPRRMTDQVALSKTLSDTLHVDPQTVDRALHAPGVRPNEFVPIVTVSKATYLGVKPIIYPVPGLEFREGPGYASVAPGFAQVLLGLVAPITAEQLRELGAPYEAGDLVGQSGLQLAYERSLAGTPSGEIRVVDPRIADQAHAVVAVVHRAAGQAPVALRTTIDVGIQQAAETAMASVTQPAALVAIDADGNVRAVVSAPVDQQFDRALDGAYPPGSTFKVITTDALLTQGLSPTSPLTCPGTITVDGKVFHNFEQESRTALTLTSAFALSCNTAFIGATQQHLSAAQLRAAAGSFGFDLDDRLGLVTQGGSFPTGGDAVETAADAIGQGKVTASPLQMASVAATVLSGQWHPPMLLPDHTTAPAPPAPLAPAVRTALTAMMHQVVTSGTGTAAAVPGRDVAGKTGTAEFGTTTPLKTHAWFIGFSGNLAVAVIVEGGGVGGQVAAPIAGRFFSLARR
jgi:cell division protein FtsI/penicillin-binding protein 2